MSHLTDPNEVAALKIFCLKRAKKLALFIAVQKRYLLNRNQVRRMAKSMFAKAMKATDDVDCTNRVYAQYDWIYAKFKFATPRVRETCRFGAALLTRILMIHNVDANDLELFRILYRACFNRLRQATDAHDFSERKGQFIREVLAVI